MLERVVADLRKEVEDLKKAKYKAALSLLWDRAAIFYCNARGGEP